MATCMHATRVGAAERQALWLLNGQAIHVAAQHDNRAAAPDCPHYSCLGKWVLESNTELLEGGNQVTVAAG